MHIWNRKTLLWKQFRDETAKCVENNINTTDSWRNNWQNFIKFGLLFPHTTLVKIKNVSYKYLAVFAKKLCKVSIFPKCTLYVKLPSYSTARTILSKHSPIESQSHSTHEGVDTLLFLCWPMRRRRWSSTKHQASAQCWADVGPAS